MRVLKCIGAIFAAPLCLIVIAATSPLLFLLGSRVSRSELVVDEELLADDPGVDVDGDA